MKNISTKYHQELKAWPFVEAFRIIEKFGGIQNFVMPSKNYVLFETGYGPSGLPHIGTFGEIVRTSMVRHAFTSLINCSTKLIVFSDDMDGLRKIPENVPNQEMLKNFLGKPLTSIPDPFGKYESFGHHNNAKLRSFLDQFKFEYLILWSYLTNTLYFEDQLKPLKWNFNLWVDKLNKGLHILNLECGTLTAREENILKSRLNTLGEFSEQIIIYKFF